MRNRMGWIVGIVGLAMIVGLAGCTGITATPRYAALIRTTAGLQATFAADVAAPDACETCVGALTRDQAREAITQSATLWALVEEATRTARGDEELDAQIERLRQAWAERADE